MINPTNYLTLLPKPQCVPSLADSSNILTKAILSILVFLTLLFFVLNNSAYAQNKVVVVPLGGGDVNKSDLVPFRVWRGSVNSDGTKRGQGRFSSTKTCTGRYRVSVDLNIPGLDTSADNIFGFGMPVASIYFGVAGDTLRISGASKSLTSGQVTSLNFNVTTYDSSNVPADKYFHFHFMLDERDGPAMANGNTFGNNLTLLKETYPDVQCTTKGDTQTCTIGDAP